MRNKQNIARAILTKNILLNKYRESFKSILKITIFHQPRRSFNVVHLTIKVIPKWNWTNAGKQGTNTSMSLYVFMFPFIWKHLHCSNVGISQFMQSENRGSLIGACGFLRRLCRNYKIKRVSTTVSQYWFTKFRCKAWQSNWYVKAW